MRYVVKRYTLLVVMITWRAGAVPSPNKLVADLLTHRRKAVEGLEAARRGGHSSVAEDYIRLIAGWDALLESYGVRPNT
jgi:hypothetical protein